MARKSRKGAANAVQVQTKAEKVYSAALYVRISVETERKREADTIGNQIQLLKDFASEQEDICVFDIYSDDDISGTDFIRPEFSRMMNDVRDGKVNCVIVKDLSRLGRNHLESGEYIEMVFPFLGVRFISVTDRFDTKNQTADISVQIKNLANELYARDISRKICSAMETTQKQGKFAGSCAPYGYTLDSETKLLSIDENTAGIVKEMFEMVADGHTLHYVATTLNARGVPSPGRYQYDMGYRKADKFKNAKWYMQTVRKILQDQTYLGWMVGGKYRSDFHTTGEKGSKPVPKEEWIITKGTHEPIVTEELFNKVQEYFVETKKAQGMTAKYNSQSRQRSMFKGHLRCGECGQAMFLRHRRSHSGEKTWWYYCALHENYNSSYCVKKAVKQIDVEPMALKLIKMQIQLFTDARSLITNLNKNEASKTRYKIYMDQIGHTRRQIEKYVEMKASLYADYTDGLLTEEDFLTMSQEYARKADELRIFLVELEKEAKKFSPNFATDGEWAKLIEQYRDAETLTAEMVDAFIDELKLFNDGHVEVTFNFKDELDEVIHLSAIRAKEVRRYAG